MDFNLVRICNDKGICSTYCMFKEVYGLEIYLVKLAKTIDIKLSKIRTGNNRLSVVRGRYGNLNREKRYCDKCNSEQLGSEYHFLSQCQNQNINQVRKTYIPEYFRVHCKP